MANTIYIEGVFMVLHVMGAVTAPILYILWSVPKCLCYKRLSKLLIKQGLNLLLFADLCTCFVLVFSDTIARDFTGKRLWRFWRLAPWRTAVCIYRPYGMVEKTWFLYKFVSLVESTMIFCNGADGSVVRSISPVEILG